MKLPDEKVNVVHVSCKDCGKMVFAGVQHLLDNKGKKEIAELVIEGHDCKTLPLIEWRKLESSYCNTECEE